MKKLATLVLLGWLLGVLIVPHIAEAGYNVYVDITATGSDNTAVPGCPSGLVITVSGHNISLSWTEGGSTDNNIVRGKWGSYPSSVSDGWDVYNGPDDNCTDIQDIAGSEEMLYYRVWAWNSAGYAPCYAENAVEGGMVDVADAIMLIPLVMLCSVLSGLGFWKIRGLWPILIIGALAWGAMGFWCFTQVNESYDIWFFVGCIGVMSLLTHIVLGPWRWVATTEPTDVVQEERLTDRLKKRKWRKYG